MKELLIFFSFLFYLLESIGNYFDIFSSYLFEILSELSRKENLTIKQLARHFVSTQGHLFVVGSGDIVADKLSEWFLKGAADGFNIKFPYKSLRRHQKRTKTDLLKIRKI